MSFEIAPFQALRYGGADLSAVTAPPYDIISADEHRSLLARSPHNVVRLTLGDRPGERADYRQRAALLESWRREGILREEREPSLYVYGVEYSVPGSGVRRSFRGVLGLGSLHEFSEKVVHPHEQTFADVVDDRYRVLEATQTHLELILLLHSDPEGRIDEELRSASGRPADVHVEARAGETHSLWKIGDAGAVERLQTFFRGQRPIIADGHHRYTTACLYRKKAGAGVPGAGWQPMVLGNLFNEDLSILATHRLVDFGGREKAALEALESKLSPMADGARWDYEIEWRGGRRRFGIPPALRATKRGVSATTYAFLHQTVLGEWLHGLVAKSGASEGVQYFKEGTGERDALQQKGGLLFRLQPVAREEFRTVVEGGEVFPHKTTFFYPKLWSGLALWALAEPQLSTPRGAR